MNGNGVLHRLQKIIRGVAGGGGGGGGWGGNFPPPFFQEHAKTHGCCMKNIPPYFAQRCFVVL